MGRLRQIACGYRAAGAALDESCATLGCSRDQLALGSILAQDFKPWVLSGAVTEGQLASNLGAEEVAELLRADPELLAQIMRELRQGPQEYWADRSALEWN